MQILEAVIGIFLFKFQIWIFMQKKLLISWPNFQNRIFFLNALISYTTLNTHYIAHKETI